MNTFDVISPVDNQMIGRISLTSKEQIVSALLRMSGDNDSMDRSEVLAFLNRLNKAIKDRKEEFFKRTWMETGFIAKDSMEMVDSAIEFLDHFEHFTGEFIQDEKEFHFSYDLTNKRRMKITRRPLRCIAGIVPQNASLPLSIIIIASALYAGARVVICPSLQCALTGELLAEAVNESMPPASGVQIFNCLVNDFLDACYEADAVDLIHYIGSNRYAASVLTDSFTHGKVCLLDGQGNGIVYFDDTVSMDEGIDSIVNGATRFNGETCTSINGVLIKENIYEDVKKRLIETFNELPMGHPMKEGVRVGPLFSRKQAAWLKETITGTGAFFCYGGHVNGAYLSPGIIEGVAIADAIVREGFFGPAVWIKKINEDQLWEWLGANRFPLSDTILSKSSQLITAFARRSRAARICVNQDPSVESMFEPWGGYPPSGFNPVSAWVEKYTQPFQLDGHIDDLLTFKMHRGYMP